VILNSFDHLDAEKQHERKQGEGDGESNGAVGGYLNRGPANSDRAAREVRAQAIAGGDRTALTSAACGTALELQYCQGRCNGVFELHFEVLKVVIREDTSLIYSVSCDGPPLVGTETSGEEINGKYYNPRRSSWRY
jgi:hypothetical protein